jgi:NAD(P)-dependent dehydrogenase (short-subunit alcohol dehydrogenase family)
MEISGKVIVVTGGGSGIGRAVVLALLARGAKVAAVDISAASLAETAQLAGSASLSTHVLDITDREKVSALPAEVVTLHGAVDGLINNAGIIQPFKNFSELDYKDIERVLNVNLYGPIHMLKSFMPLLKQRPEAHIVNVSSMGGFFPFPGQTLYGASKAALKLLTEGLYAELLETKIGVTVVFPGAIKTNIAQNSGVTMIGADATAESSFPMTSAEAAAGEIIAAIDKNKFQVFIGRDSKMMNLFYKLSPKIAVRFIQKQMKSLLPA